MNEKEFVEIAKQYLEQQGYEIVRLMGATPEFVRRAYRVNMTNRDYAVARIKQGNSTPDYVILFVNESRFGQGSCAGAYPDIVAIKNGKPYMFEVKTDLENEQLDRCIGQCLRYVAVYPFDRITLVVPEGTQGAPFLREVVRLFKLPIAILELPA